MTPEQALETLSEAAEGWPQPNRYDDALSVLARELERLPAALALLKEALDDEVAWGGEELVERMEQVYETLGGKM